MRYSRPGRRPDRLLPPFQVVGHDLLVHILVVDDEPARGFWLYGWFQTTPHDQVGAALAQVFELVADGTIRIPKDNTVRMQQFADAVRLAEAPAPAANRRSCSEALTMPAADTSAV
jgi:hypothetical protein